MKPTTSLFLFSGLLLTTIASAQDDRETPYRTENFTGNLSNVRVETSGGGITVEGGQSGGVKVEMYVRPNNWPQNQLSKAEIDERLKDDYVISISKEGNTVVATAKRKGSDNWDWKRSLNISFKVYTPRNIGTDLRTSGGGIRLSRLTGQQNFQTSGGGLKLDDLDGVIRGRTSGGGIDFTNCRKDIELTTSGGSINARNSTGNLKLRTSGGSIKLEDLKGEVDASTSGGSINADGVDGELVAGTSGGSIRMRDIAGSVRASTSAGSIEADITRVGEYVRLSTSAGSVRVRMPMNKGLDLDLRGNRVSAGELSKFDGTMERDRVRGRLNGGGIPVNISASSGSVYLNQN